MSRAGPRRVAILGGGIAGLTAAWELSRSEHRGRFVVTVYERDWKLGGKGASSRGTQGRIEEHGLHVWPGYYDNSFRLLREVYEELDRPRTDPESPILGWRDAFLPANHVGAADPHNSDNPHWLARFAGNDQEPGGPSRTDGAFPTTFVASGLRLLVDFLASHREAAPAPVGVVISASPLPPRGAAPDDFAGAVRQAEIASLIAAVESLRLLRTTVPEGSELAGRLLEILDRTREDLLERLRLDTDARHSWQLADVLITCMRGILEEGLLASPSSLSELDRYDFRSWLSRHGAEAESLQSPLVRVMYDFVFGYEDGDPERPAFSAGLGLFLAFKLFFAYRGAIFWKMRAGMGDVVFAPMYEALRVRGVRFAFAHQVERLHIDRSRRTIGRVSLSCDPAGWDMDPLVRVKGLPCFPSRQQPHRRDAVQLVAGEDYDTIVLATPLGTLSRIAAELIDDSTQWRAMTMFVATVATRSLQLWMRAGEDQLGWPLSGATVAGYPPPFEVYASMTHTLPAEDWPEDDAPAAVGYFCGALPDGHGPADVHDFVRDPIARFWPGYRDELVVSRYARVNVDPSERYVQSLPGTGQWRLAADNSRYDNLVLAGDWIDSGLNAGCIEAAVLSGLEAANAVRERPLMDGVLGTWSRT